MKKTLQMRSKRSGVICEDVDDVGLLPKSLLLTLPIQLRTKAEVAATNRRPTGIQRDKTGSETIGRNSG